ncbi:unnamed protein product [Rotaria sp. Silwood2]|nr:unnamed protein product [Rotaria sp. Silwood2]CAF2866410.1 unnamed protein product [Rotaria sp. Silwood2]CAF3173215.1 unnamed protein product [Rotaria sp. Silwood2]CAF3331267.1 unnamed protein product [Rotaria sp. Silwood2]CAF4057338.1 unnamed protein product [Rotaria sp. Silwood2]
MPKVRRKRLSTARNRLNRPKKLLAKATTASNQQIKAVYFDLVAQPNELIKSKSTGKFIQLSKPPRNLKVSDDWDVKTGDVLSWSEGRPTETFFVTSEGTLLKNPDTSGSGYLTIPLSITSQFSNAVDYFSSVLDSIGCNYVSSIELAPTDSFFEKNFSKELPASIQNRTDISYSFDPNDKVLYVTLASNPKQSQHFQLETTKIDDIIQWISTSNETKAKFIVKYNFEGKETCSKVPRGIIMGLPGGWQCEQQGSMLFGENKIQGEWKCEGTEKTKEKARKAIEKHYKGLDVEIK